MVAAILAASVACSTGSAPGSRGASDPGPSQTSTRRHKGLCQPFPDRLIDEFLAAYNGRDLDSLAELVLAERIVDDVAGAYAGDSTFDNVTEWAEHGWGVDDRMDLVAYTAFHPTKRGFQMHMTRRSAALEDRQIEAVSTTLDAISSGCSIESLEMSDAVQAKGAPCAFYQAFGTIEDVSVNEPETCRDGSGRHARVDHAAVWTGKRVLLWGGTRGGSFTYGDIAMDGLSFDPSSGRWLRIPELESLPSFTQSFETWTGNELIVFGSKARGRAVVGAAYEPAGRSWRIIELPYRGWSGFEGAWTGAELVLWGGPDHTEQPKRRGAVYRPATDSWRKTTPAPIGGRWSHSVVWTGNEMIVWGGGDANVDLADGAAYDPATDSWRRLPPSPLSPRQWLPIVWTGSEAIVWGGSSSGDSRANGAAYDPESDSWRKLPPAPLRPRHYHSATWTGSEVIVFGGYDYRRSFGDGAAYDPASNSWRRIAPAPLAPRCCHSSLWTGAELFVFGGGKDIGEMAHGDGALYDPARDRWRRVIPSP